jgi:Uma2 family endonuclease
MAGASFEGSPVAGIITPAMAAILDLPEVRARLSRWSVEAYEALDEMGVLDRRAELIRGLIVQKMPKSPLHCKLIKRIFLYLLALQRAGWVVFSERPLRLADSEPEPDVMIVRGRESDYDAKHPTSAELVVEIAVSSPALDRENASLYAEAGVSEYWIVLGAEGQIEVYRQPENGVYQQKRLYSKGEMLTCDSVPGLQVELAEWFA